NQKVIIFTVYRDTAEYLFKQLKSRGFDKLAMVSGSGSLTSDSNEETNKFEPILERFAPYTKLYMEKEWEFHTKQKGMNAFYEWQEWIKENQPRTYKKLQQPIDILIATDALSEGQNLQDSDMVINYDIHWNPVRIIQRMGRIDRLGSPNKKVHSINFWPSDNINTYLNLQGRIEQRMAAMKLAGSEVDLQFSDSFKEMAQDESLEQKMTNRMLEQMQITLDDIEVNEQSLGFNDLSLEQYRQDLLAEFLKDKDRYKSMPRGLYTGFKADKTICPQPGLIALLGYPAKPSKIKDHVYRTFNLIYINNQGEEVLLNQKEVLEALTYHKDNERFVPRQVDCGEEGTINGLAQSLKHWLDRQAYSEEKQEDGTVKKKMGKESLNMLSNLRKGDRDAIDRVKQNKKASDKFQLDNFDLITWFLITPN
ncbi:MAG: helicase, partial [Bacteroidales bacterium]|nr:helicase [Bacteroidales bacterium]